MGAQVSQTDYEWVYTEEPHATRRKEILAKYPEVKKLMGHEPRTKYIVTAMVSFQILMLYLISDASWITLVVLAYVLGGTINHSLTLAIHEIAHNLAFGHSYPLANRFLGYFANLPLGVPMSVSFKKYHLEHHRYQGDVEKDVDIPSEIEGRFFNRTWSKFVYLLLMPYFYTLRPLFMRPKPVMGLELLNFVIQVVFDVCVYYCLGPKPIFYMIGGTFLGTGLHPLSGHFIAEHYMFIKGCETYSYYGPLNYLTFNVGYHNEHHDFPYIPGSRLYKVKEIAPEYYDNLPQYSSWCRVIYNFITDPTIGPFSRVRRRIQDEYNEKKQNGENMTMNGKQSGKAHIE